ncbi:MAG TPA: acyltransferase [Pirellulales bacterium]|nr:acyltransferase [Pirellulales bacterium]
MEATSEQRGSREIASLDSTLTGRIPGLDGLRGVSIVVISVAHFSVAQNLAAPEWFRQARFLGGPSVDMFFVISGFLITLLLLREWDREGTISLSQFFARRALRILPAYAAFLVATAFLQPLGVASLGGRGWALALTYTVNFVPHPPAWIGHVWSLSVEEHFYLVWPLALCLCGRRGALRLLAVAVAGAAALRFALFRMLSRDAIDLDLLTLTRMDTIAVGCLLAFLVREPRARPFFEMLRPRATLVALLAVMMLLASICVFGTSGKYCLLIKRPLEAALFALVIAACLANDRSLLRSVLSCRPLVALGVLSYSLYLWQPLLHPPGNGWPYAWPVNIACATACAVISHVCVERPCLRCKRWLTTRRDYVIRPALEPSV